MTPREIAALISSHKPCEKSGFVQDVVTWERIEQLADAYLARDDAVEQTQKILANAMVTLGDLGNG